MNMRTPLAIDRMKTATGKTVDFAAVKRLYHFSGRRIRRPLTRPNG